MHNCEAICELIPWYVTGTLEEADLQAMNAHLDVCEACRADVLDAMQLRTEARTDLPDVHAAMRRSWEALDAWLEPSSSRIDVGSFLLGLSFGVTAGRRSGVDGTLRFLGQEIRILGRKGRRP